MIANSNIDFLALKNTSVADTIPRRFLIWLYMAVLAQPFFHSLVFWLVSEDILTTITGFLFGTAMVTIWMSYDSGFIRALNRCVHRCNFYKHSHHKVRTVYNHIDSALHLFLVFIVPPISVIGISLYAVSTFLLTLSPALT